MRGGTAIAEAPVPSGVALGLAGALLALGAGFTARPRLGAAVFGLPRQDEAALPYVRALGFRDVALGAALAALALKASPRALGLLCAASALIPLSDMALVGSRRGREAAVSLGLHGLSAGVLTGLAVALLGAGRRG
ncbi:MAG TPA: DUF4267 domain-containing protein [Caulobacteraceae bacterium]|nr:DUF4267 domain-containing protein [Caulobacteraceae bacterium]